MADDGAPRFSLVTVCFNDRVNLESTLASLPPADPGLYEWLVIDGHSQDGTDLVLKRLAGRPGTTLVSEPDRGLYDAMNKGIALARGDYVIFLNAGDRLASAATLLALSRLAGNAGDPDLLYGDAVERSLAGSLRYKRALPRWLVWYGMFTHHQAMAYRRARLACLRFDMSYRIAADYDLTGRFLSGRASAARTSRPLCVFLTGGLSHRNRWLGHREEYRMRVHSLRMPTPIAALLALGKVALDLAKRSAPRLHAALRFAPVAGRSGR